MKKRQPNNKQEKALEFHSYRMMSIKSYIEVHLAFCLIIILINFNIFFKYLDNFDRFLLSASETSPSHQGCDAPHPLMLLRH